MREFPIKNCRMEIPQAQAIVCGEGSRTCICGCVLFSPLRCGVIVQVHIRNLPASGFFGLHIEKCGSRIVLPPLLSCDGEALMSVYLGGASVCRLSGGSILVTAGPDCCSQPVIACGIIRPCRPQRGCAADPRPLFASPIHC